MNSRMSLMHRLQNSGKAAGVLKVNLIIATEVEELLKMLQSLSLPDSESRYKKRSNCVEG